MARWTQPHEVREYARVAHMFIEAMLASMNLIVIDRHGVHHAGRLIRSSTHQDPHSFPPKYAGEFTIVGLNEAEETFDLLDIKDVYPLFTPEQAAAQVPPAL